jgi:hypothetical protein
MVALTCIAVDCDNIQSELPANIRLMQSLQWESILYVLTDGAAPAKRSSKKAGIAFSAALGNPRVIMHVAECVVWRLKYLAQSRAHGAYPVVWIASAKTTRTSVYD